MATFKAYTTIEQSKKLAEILPLESADYFVSEECELTCRHVTTVEKLQKILDVCGLDTNISSYLSHRDPFI